MALPLQPAVTGLSDNSTGWGDTGVRTSSCSLLHRSRKACAAAITFENWFPETKPKNPNKKAPKQTGQTQGLFPLLSQCTLFSCCLQLNSHTGQKQVALRNDQISSLHAPSPTSGMAFSFFIFFFFRKSHPTLRNKIKRKGITRNVTQASP